jgi:fibronectin type 3 domain-containing protein
MTEEEFAARATLVGSVNYDEIRRAGDTLNYEDSLELAGQPARLRYAIRYVNSSGQQAAFSNFFLFEPAAKIAAPPRNVRKTESETAITINWDAPQANIDGSTPVNLLGYNVYRTIASQPQSGKTPLNKTVITSTGYDDKNFKFGEKYTYVVRTVSLGTLATPVESLDSNSVPVNPIDKYAPKAPEPISHVPSAGKIALFWPPNSEPDLAGYILFRSTDPNIAKDKWLRLTPALYTKTTFTDESVEAGKTYYYYLVAVDSAGNVSDPSEVAAETVPPEMEPTSDVAEKKMSGPRANESRTEDSRGYLNYCN